MLPGDPEVRQPGTGALSRRIDEAMAEISKALELRPDLPDAQNNLGSVLLQGPDRRGPRALSGSHSARARPGRIPGEPGAALGANGMLPEAVEAFREAIRIDPENPRFHSSLGLALAKLERLDEAVESFGRALRLDPGSAEAHQYLALVLERKGRVSEAIEHMSRAAMLKPESASIRKQLARLEELRRSGEP